jgi:hypothetical protein
MRKKCWSQPHTRSTRSSAPRRTKSTSSSHTYPERAACRHQIDAIAWLSTVG